MPVKSRDPEMDDGGSLYIEMCRIVNNWVDAPAQKKFFNREGFLNFEQPMHYYKQMESLKQRYPDNVGKKGRALFAKVLNQKFKSKWTRLTWIMIAFYYLSFNSSFTLSFLHQDTRKPMNKIKRVLVQDLVLLQELIQKLLFMKRNLEKSPLLRLLLLLKKQYLLGRHLSKLIELKSTRKRP